MPDAELPDAMPPDAMLPDAEPEHVAVTIDRHHNPFLHMSERERMRLFIRVLCELVAYGEVDDDGAPLPRPAPAHRRAKVRPGI